MCVAGGEPESQAVGQGEGDKLADNADRGPCRREGLGERGICTRLSRSVVCQASITQAEEPAGAKERLQKVHAGWGGAWRTQSMAKNRRGKGHVLYETWAYIAACLLHHKLRNL